MVENPLLQALRGGFDAHPAIQVACLYGSVARGDSGPTSDVDVALLADQPIDLMVLAALGGQLEAMIHRAVDVVDLLLAPPLLCRQVVAEGKPLIVRDPQLKFEFEQAAVRCCEDTRPLRAQHQRLLRERVAHGG